MLKKIIWGVPIGMVAVGLLIVLFSYMQPSYTATIIAVGDESYTSEKKMVRGTSKSVYREQLEVNYGDGQIAKVTFSSAKVHPLDLPKEGDEIQICRWITGMVTHPNRTLVGIGGAMAGIGGFFLFLFILTEWSVSRH